jgi:tetratricopeptide (TPR) repeat protein
VNLLQRFKITRDLHRMERQAKQEPSPTTFVDLAQVYINLGRIEDTLRIAEEGLLLFPRSEELRKVHKFAKRRRLTERSDELRAKITRAPEPELFHELARVYLDMGDVDALIGTCTECVRHFPSDVESYFCVAEARLQSFYRNLNAIDGQRAVSGMRKVLELDSGHPIALRKLGELYYRVGALLEAKETLSKLSKVEALDEDLKLLYAQCKDAQEAIRDLGQRFEDIESRGSLPNRSVTGLRKERSIASEDAVSTIRDGLARMVQLEGVSKAAYIRGSKALVKGNIRSGKDPFLKTVRIVAKASQRVARRMELGNFSKGVIDGDFGHIVICSFGDVAAAVQCGEKTSIDRILADLQELVAGSLFVSGGLQGGSS